MILYLRHRCIGGNRSCSKTFTEEFEPCTFFVFWAVFRFGVTLVGADVYPSLLGFELNGSDVVEVEVEAPGGGWQAGQNT